MNPILKSILSLFTTTPKDEVMTTATVTFTTVDTQLPVTTDPAGFLVSLLLGTMPVGGSIGVNDALTPVAISITGPGSYHVKVDRLDTAGVVLGSAYSAVFVVPDATPVTPVTITVAIPSVVAVELN